MRNKVTGKIGLIAAGIAASQLLSAQINPVAGERFQGEATSDTLRISFSFTPPISAPSSQEGRKSLFIPPPDESWIVLSQDRSIKLTIVSQNIRELAAGTGFGGASDLAIGLEESSTFTSPALTEGSGLNQEYLGSFQNGHLIRIRISPRTAPLDPLSRSWRSGGVLVVMGRGIKQLSPSDLSELKRLETGRTGREGSVFSDRASRAGLRTGSERHLKIWIDEEGPVVLPHALLQDAGWESAGVDPRLLRVVGKDGEIPIQVSGENDGSFDFNDEILFYGEPVWGESLEGYPQRHLYATRNVYWLEKGDTPGLRYGQEEAGVPESDPAVKVYPRSYPHTEHIETDSYFYRLPNASKTQDYDYWFHTSPVSGGKKRQQDIWLSSPDIYATQLVQLRIRFWGQTGDLGESEVDVFINDNLVASGSWLGTRSFILESSAFSPTYLIDGKNTITISNRSESGEIARLMLDWIEITYPRLYEADDDYLRFKPPVRSRGKICHFEIEGFTNQAVEVYKKGISRIYGCEIEARKDSLGPTTYRVIFEDQVIDENTEYLAFTHSAKALPDSVHDREVSGLRSPDTGADYVIIVPHDSLGGESIQDLVELRESQGHRIKEVLLEDVYDAFSMGIPHARAIRDFMRYAWNHWSLRPAYLLLIGDGTIDNRRTPEEGNLIPTSHFHTTKYGAAAADHIYSLASGDDAIPEIAVGRFPVRDRESLVITVDKIVSYETGVSGIWRNRYLLIGAAGYQDVFRNQSEDLIENVIPQRMRPERLYLSGSLSDPYVGGTEDLLRYFQEGVMLVNFRGHGGGAIWSDNGLLDLDDVELIENRGKLPFVTSMTCFTTDFASDLPTLGEEMVLHEETGAIAMWGATGVGWVWNDYYLLRELLKCLEKSPGTPLGELLRCAKTSYLMKYSGDLPLSEAYQFTLLGDPGLRLAMPATELPMQLESRAVERSDSVRVTGSMLTGSGELCVELAGKDLSAAESHTFSLTSPAWRVSLKVPEDTTLQIRGVRAFLEDPSTGYLAHGYLPLEVDHTYFDSLMTMPASPASKDTVQFSVVVEDPGGIQDVWCVVHNPDPESIPMDAEEDGSLYVTRRGAGPYPPGTVLVYSFSARNLQGRIMSSDTVQKTILSLPDMAVQSLNLGGTDRVELELRLSNNGGERVKGVSVRVQSPDLSWSQEDTISLEAFEEKTVAMELSPAEGNIRFIASVDPDSLYPDSERNNNRMEIDILIDRFPVSPEWGTYLTEGVSDTVKLGNLVRFYIPPGAVEKQTIAGLTLLQGGEEDLPIDIPDEEKILQVVFPGRTRDRLDGDFTLVFLPAYIDSLSLMRAYLWREAVNEWVSCDYQYKNQQMLVQSNESGYFRLASSQDIQSPVIEIQMNDQPFTQGSYVASQPVMSAIIQDESGVDIRRDKIRVYLDDVLQDPSKLILPDSTHDIQSVTVTFRPQFESGDHSLFIAASDIHGNEKVTETIRFRVGAHLSIQYLGNHPNPFRRETIFAYILTDVARRVTLKIYTVSGRLIRTFEDPGMAMPDYHEVLWDGRDDWGEPVANGVYFFRIQAEGENGIQEITGKAAKLR
jgi:hypothetical protein